MNIYRVTVPEPLLDGLYDIHDGIVCYATDEGAARDITGISWPCERLRLIVELVGQGDGKSGEIILMSFLAG